MLVHNGHQPLPPWEEIPADTRAGWIDEACAAITDMREPTDAMWDAGYADGGWGDNEGAGGPNAVWRAMIDAALK